MPRYVEIEVRWIVPWKVAGFSKLKYLLPVALRHLSPVIHGEYVLTRRTKHKLHGEVRGSSILPEVLYLLETTLREKDKLKFEL